MATGYDNGHDDDEPIYGNNEAIVFHYITSTGSLLGPAECPETRNDGDFNNNGEETDDSFDDFSSDEEETECSVQAVHPEEHVQQRQEENIQGNICNEEPGYRELPSSSRNIPSRTQNESRPCFLGPPTSRSANQYHDVCPMPRRPSPSREEMDPAVNGVLPQPPNNESSPDSQFVDHMERRPDPPYVQRTGLQNRIQQFETHETNASRDICNEETRYKQLPSSPRNSPSRMQNNNRPWSVQQPPSRSASQYNKISQMPRTPRPSREEMDPSVNGVLPQPPNNESSPGSHFVDRMERRPDPPSVQRTGLQDKIQQFETHETNASPRSSPARSRTFPEERETPTKSPPASNDGTSYIKVGTATIVLTPLLQSIMDKPYCRFISRNTAEELIQKERDGAFIIRPSTKSGHPLTITVNCEGLPYHINIRQRPDSLFALGQERAVEEVYSSIDELVRTHHTKPLMLTSGASPRLEVSPKKSTNINTYIQHKTPYHKKNSK